MKKIAILLLNLTLLASACKKKADRPHISPQPTAEIPGSSNETPEQPAMIDAASDELFAAVLAGLKANHASAENQTWFQSLGLIEGEWIAYSPKNYWGKTILELPSGYDCEKGKLGCDIQFERKLCNTDLDCAASRTQCLPLLASVSKPGDQPKLMCLGSGDKVMDDYYSTLVKTDRHLDIASLTLPSGRFRTALINGLTYLTHKLPTYSFRLLLSSTDGITPNIFNRPSKVMGDILSDIDANGGDSKKIKMNLGYLSDKKVSWNHTKIVLADSNHLLQGGHNFLDPDYVREQPIFDISMHVSGRVGEGVQKFVDHLWSKSSSMASNFGNEEKVVAPAPAAAAAGKVKIIGMGRMGSFGDNASDEGFRLLLKSAKKTIYLAQQDIYNDISKLGAKPSHALPELVDAVLRGVRLKVVQSSSTAFLGYGTVAPDKAAVMLREAITKEADARKFVAPNNLTLGEYLCKQVEYAPFLFHPKVLRWANDTDIGVHPKLIIIDETGFYMGSQNFYPSDLQEFGLFISDSAITGQLIEQYWNKIWANSSLNKVACR